ncbi:MAG: glycosyltransferase [Lachnospiraceae bacterium]|nr:glycosyltransferase [Lachnospiraceae bacterium]
MQIISVIVPVFHGKKYIDRMIVQLERCVAEYDGRCILELLLVNDDPCEPIGSCFSETVVIKVIETDINRGIHGARVRGLEQCTGDYVLFLDQDDHIRPEYFSSQLECIGEADASVCRLLHEGRQFYDTRMPFEKVISREYIVGVRNPIISPGQVLLRKDSIPEIWRRIGLKHNGADDWLLWICMLVDDCKFALNKEILFEHVVEGSNESINAEHMIQSEREVYWQVAQNGILTGKELERLYMTVESAAEDHIRVLSKFQKMFFVYHTWMNLYEQGVRLEDYLVRRGIRTVAIYGFSYIGKRLYHSLNKGKVCVKYFIDMNAEYLKEEMVSVYLPDGQAPAVDMIIISLVEEVESIRKKLTDLSDARVCAVTELFEDMKNTLSIGNIFKVFGEE